MVVELRRISELSKESGIPESTIRRWIESFRHYFAGKKIGKTTYYHPDALDVLKRLKTFYDAGRSTEEIEEILSMALPKTITIEPENPPPPEPLPERKDTLFSLIEKSIDQRREIQLLAVQLLRRDDDLKELRERIAAVESKDTEIATLKTEIETLKKIIDYTNANAELLHERVEKIEHPPNETIWQAFRQMFTRKRTR